MGIHSSVEKEVKQEGPAFFSISVELFWWIASQLSCECRGSCRNSSSASSSTTASASAAPTATAKGNSLDSEAGSCGYCCGGLRLGACHDVGREDLWGGSCLLSLVCGVFGVGV